MHHELILGKFLSALLLAFLLQHEFISCLPEESSKDDSQNIQDNMVKRDWNNQLKMWGKRAWSNLHGGWGVKRSAYDDQDLPLEEKRAWNNLRAQWGKRLIPSDEEYAYNQLALFFDQPRVEELMEDENMDNRNNEKRSWKQLNDGWGKRSKWNEFRGSWGKREPAWSNLKGIWGKRSYPEAETYAL